MACSRHHCPRPSAEGTLLAAIHVSSGGISPAQRVSLARGNPLPLAEAIVAEGRADAVALARAMLYDPRWPWHAAARLGAQVSAPPQYWRSQPREVKDLFTAARMGMR